MISVNFLIAFSFSVAAFAPGHRSASPLFKMKDGKTVSDMGYVTVYVDGFDKPIMFNEGVDVETAKYILRQELGLQPGVGGLKRGEISIVDEKLTAGQYQFVGGRPLFPSG